MSLEEGSWFAPEEKRKQLNKQTNKQINK